MSDFDNKEFYERIDQLIRMKATGSPTELSNRLGISESHLYRVLRKMKDEAKCPIEFSKNDNSYVYKSKGKLVIKFCFNTIEEGFLSKIKGGKINLDFFTHYQKMRVE